MLCVPYCPDSSIKVVDGKMSGMEGRSLFAPDFERNAADLKAFLYG